MSSVCHEFLVEKLEEKPKRHPIKKKRWGGEGRKEHTKKKKAKREMQERYEMHDQLRSVVL